MAGSLGYCVALVLRFGLLASALLARRLVAVTVRGMSMQPTYHDGDRVVARRDLVPTVGQVIVVQRPALETGWRTLRLPTKAGSTVLSSREWMIKRVVAVPGDPIPRDQIPALANVPEERVPAGKLILLGDNRTASFDSRQVGYFPADQVLGVVQRILPLPCTAPKPDVGTMTRTFAHKAQSTHSRN